MRATQPVDVGFRDRHRLVGVQLGVQRDDRGHQLGERGDRQLRFHVLAEENLAGLLVDDQRGLRFQRRLAQLAREHRGRDDRQRNQGYRDEPHPPSLLLVGPVSLAPTKLICNENNGIREILHTTSRKEPALPHPPPGTPPLKSLPPARPLPAAGAPTSGRKRRLAPAVPCGCHARRYGPDPDRESGRRPSPWKGGERSPGWCAPLRCDRAKPGCPARYPNRARTWPR